jgi:hypothetical protein
MSREQTIADLIADALEHGRRNPPTVRPEVFIEAERILAGADAIKSGHLQVSPEAKRIARQMLDGAHRRMAQRRDRHEP